MSKIYIEKRPWGNFKQFTHNELSTVKIITVKPNSKLSLQYHNNRNEMWYFLTEGFVQLGKKTRKVKKGSVIEIKKKMLHRVYSKNNEVVFLEVSFGKFDEKDIVRIEDIYGRIK